MKHKRLSKGEKTNMYNVKNCFMFEEEESPKADNTVKNLSSISDSKVTEFRTDKPYRLALYVQPSLKRTNNITNSTVLANLSLLKDIKNKENLSSSKVAKKPRILKGKAPAGLFEEESEISRREKKVAVNIEKYVIKEQPSKILKTKNTSNVNTSQMGSKSIKDVDGSSLPKPAKRKFRKSYEKKFKEYADSEKVPDPPSDQILKEMDMKKITRSKIKKPNKEEQEFEKWAENMNSAFDDIDKFELSINYD